MSIAPVSHYNHRIQRDGIAFYDWPFQNELMETRVHNISCSVLKDFTVVLIECKVWSRRMHVHRHAKVYFNDRELYARVFEPRYEKTGFLHMRKQKRRSASR